MKLIKMFTVLSVVFGYIGSEVLLFRGDVNIAFTILVFTLFTSRVVMTSRSFLIARRGNVIIDNLKLVIALMKLEQIAVTVLFVTLVFRGLIWEYSIRVGY